MPNQDFINDQSLLLMIAEGDETAFRALFKKHAPIVYKGLSRFIISSAVKEDIVQETFLRVWIHRDKLTGIQNFSSWALRIAYNLTFTYLRNEAAHQKILSNVNLVHAEDYTYERIELNFLKDLVAKAVANLSPQQKKIYLLNRESGLTISQISEKLSLSPQTIKNTLGLALKSIRSFIEANGYPLMVVLLCLNKF